jgi:hypothetical protein
VKPKLAGSIVWFSVVLMIAIMVAPLAAETLTVPFTGGVSAATTALSYSGNVWIVVSGTGSVTATPPNNDAFFIFTDPNGVDITPLYPDPNTVADSGILCINGAAAQFSIPGWTGAPIYNPLHVYTLLANVPAGPISFGALDANAADDLGSYTVTVAIAAQAKIDPQTLNLRSKGKWVTAFIKLPAGMNAKNINRASLLLNGVIPAAAKPWAVSDPDGDGVKEQLMVKFDRMALQSMLIAGSNLVTIAGNLTDGSSFLATATVKAISPGKKK